MNKYLIVALSCLFFSSLSIAEQLKSCKANPLVSGSCYEVRGRLSIYNGGPPNFRIWPIGTHRLLGVSEGKYLLKGYRNIPEEIENQLNWNNAMFATFLVCPFEKQEPGKMQLVCVESAKSIVIKSQQ